MSHSSPTRRSSDLHQRVTRLSDAAQESGHSRMKPMEKIGLGGGCRWCTEGIFQMLRGVPEVDQGFIRSDPPADRWAEGVIVHFDPLVIDLAILVEVHLRTHAASAPYVAKSKYRKIGRAQV